jgi:hypothetical protein
MKAFSRFILGLAVVMPSYSHAQSPITDKAVFETEYLNCFKKGEVKRCLPPLIKKHYIRRFTDEELNQLLNVYVSWLSDDRVYTIHKVKNIQVAEFYDQKTYLIEDTRGSVVLMVLGLRSIKGSWFSTPYDFLHKRIN